MNHGTNQSYTALLFHPYGCKKEDTPPEELPPEPFQGIIKRLFTTLAYSGMGEPWETLGSMGTHV